MATDRKTIVRNAFRRSSSTEHDKHDKVLMVEVNMMPTILNRMGQKVDEKRLMQFIEGINTEHSGYLDFDKFTRVCDKFLTNPAMLEKVKGDDFSFKHLLTPEDFINP